MADYHAELKGKSALRAKLGARIDEGFADFLSRIHAERDAAEARVRDLSAQVEAALLSDAAVTAALRGWFGSGPTAASLDDEDNRADMRAALSAALRVAVAPTATVQGHDDTVADWLRVFDAQPQALAISATDKPHRYAADVDDVRSLARVVAALARRELSRGALVPAPKENDQ